MILKDLPPTQRYVRTCAVDESANGSASVQQLYQKSSHHLLLRVGGRDSLQDCVYLLQKEKKFVVVVPATPLGTQDPRQALESVSQEGLDVFFFFFEMVYLCVALSVVNCVRMVPVTAPRQAENILLESLFGCASGPRLHVETHVVRTAASLRMTAVSEFCHCVHAKCSERGASVAFLSVGRRNR